MGRRRNTGWVPNQHGAWAMLVVPFLVGAIMARDSLGWWTLTLFAFWMLGYFAFHAASLWLKAAPRKRPGYVRPLLTHAALATILGVLTLVLGGAAMAWWVLPYLPLMLPALWLASRRRERATLGGALTVAAACLMTLVVTFPDPRGLPAHPDAPAALTVTALLFAYFFGTVLYVKTNIRERGSSAYLAASIGWHALWTGVCGALAIGGRLPWWWALFFAVTTVRAWYVPRLGWSARRLGLVEAVLCVVLVLAFWLA